jgi:anti-sigma28 factor (negative regulator of flagellin synthesis)
MHIHSSTSLEGPVSGDRDWWRTLNAPAAEERPFRADLVARIRHEIAEGKYGTDEQLEKALEELLRRLEKSGQ